MNTTYRRTLAQIIEADRKWNIEHEPSFLRRLLIRLRLVQPEPRYKWGRTEDIARCMNEIIKADEAYHAELGHRLTETLDPPLPIETARALLKEIEAHSNRATASQ